MTIRTVQLASGVLAQGELVLKDRPFCSCADGYIDIDRCDCQYGWVSRATVRLPDGTERTGKLMPQHTDMTRPGDTIHDT